VEEISEMARVNKALIYYYFESKEAILRELFRKFVDEILTEEDLSDIENILDSPEQMQELFLRNLLMLEERKDLLRIFFMEALKEPKGDFFADGFLESILRCHKETMQQTNMKLDDPQDFLVLEFFTAVMPVASYVLFKDHWCRRFSLTEEVLREKFIQIFLKTHLTYTKEVMGSRKKD